MLIKLAQFGLPIWFITSFSLWIWLPSDNLLRLTPFICAILLASISGILGLVLHQIYRAKLHRLKSFYGVLFAAFLAPPAAIIFAYNLAALLSIYPLRELAALAWFLSSMGAVLTVIVCRLLSDIIDTQASFVDEAHVKPQANANFNTTISTTKSKT